MEWGTPVYWGRFLLSCVPQSVKTKETNPTRPGSPTPCKQALSYCFSVHVSNHAREDLAVDRSLHLVMSAIMQADHSVVRNGVGS